MTTASNPVPGPPERHEEAVTALAELILGRVTRSDPIGLSLRAALDDPEGVRRDRLWQAVEREDDRLMNALQPYLDRDPELKSAYYGNLDYDSKHHAEVVSAGHLYLELLGLLLGEPGVRP